MSPDDTRTVASQLGRTPRGRWRVAVRCSAGAPAVIAISPRLEDGTPFPTHLWLTCPVAVEMMGACESKGEGAEWSRRAESDPGFAAALERAAGAYRSLREAEADEPDPCQGGVGGERDLLRVKCLHARLAAALAGVPDPVGLAYRDAVLSAMDRCDGSRCVIAASEDAVSSAPGDQTNGG